MASHLRAAALGCAALAVWLGCAAGLPVARHFDPIEQFPAHAAWRWDAARNQLPQDERLAAIGLGPLVEQTVSAELAARGYREAGADPPDYLVSYQLRFSPQMRVERSFTMGSLSLSLHSAKHGGQVWVAFVQTEVDVNRTPAERSDRLREVVRHMLEDFPPGADR
jgi:hypothetical protein